VRGIVPGSWIHWHALYDASTRPTSTGEFTRAEELKRAGSVRDLVAQTDARVRVSDTSSYHVSVTGNSSAVLAASEFAFIGAGGPIMETSLISDLFVHAPPTMSLRAPLLPPQPSQARGEASDGPLIREARELVGKQRNDACTRMYGLTVQPAAAAYCVVEPRPLKRVRVARGGA
jgi:hypothetical protein